MIKYDRKHKVWFIKLGGKKITGHNKDMLKNYYHNYKFNNR